ncbi:MAG: phosphate ABC transporter ATP-binding protein [Phycisphaerae bacterium]|nr:phosphate ABC transporter ATP-binding protein [Phycisphaerae bacterium]
MTGNPKISLQSLSVRYGRKSVLRNISFAVPANSIFAIIGPANSGKTTLLKCLNRTIEIIAGSHVDGQICIDGLNIHAGGDVYSLRRRIGMVFPLPVGLPMSVFDNVAYAPRMAGVRDKELLGHIVEDCLTKAALWDEVKDRLDSLGSMLSGGQQQRLTIARALSHDPEILCLDEFSIAIDPVTTMRIEDMLVELKERMTIILVTNLVQQARRLSDRTCFLNKGELVQEGPTEEMFGDSNANRLTYDYVRGVFG